MPIKLSATPGTLRTPSARFGQHTLEILAEYGYSEAHDLSLLRNTGNQLPVPPATSDTPETPALTHMFNRQNSLLKT